MLSIASAFASDSVQQIIRDLKQLFKMESRNLTSGSTEELKEPLIGKEENLERPQPRISKGRSTDYVPQPVIDAPPPKERPEPRISKGRCTDYVPHRVTHPKDSEMDKNESISIVSVEIPKELIIDVHENLEPHPLCCIYRVPRALRKMNEEAYTPKVISIGPLHHGKDEFADMEKQKIRFIGEFGKRIRPEKWKQLINFIEENEQRIRNSYEENFKLEKFIIKILYDAVFIIELFLRYYRQERDFLLERSCLKETILSDLRLLENQLPFFVLDGLHKLAFPNLGPEIGYPSFILLSCVFFGHCKRDGEPSIKAEDILHFTHLERHFMTMKYPEYLPESDREDFQDSDREDFPKSDRENLRDLPCAAKLQASGVQFIGIKGESLLDIRFEEKKLLGISCLKVADQLQIPHIDVDDHMESSMRNVMALEQCHYPDKTLVCNYVHLMDTLIDTDEDVSMLAEAGIISNYLGEGARIAKMYNDLCLEIRVHESNYAGIIKDLRLHYDNKWNKAKATLKRVYFSNLWKGSGTVAAFLLLVFNLIQAMRTIISAFE